MIRRLLKPQEIKVLNWNFGSYKYVSNIERVSLILNAHVIKYTYI